MHIDLRVKFQIAAKLDEVSEVKDGVKTYAFGWTDQRIARELGVTAKHVQTVRRAYCPEMVVVRGGGDGRPPRNMRLRSEFAELLKKNEELNIRITKIEDFLTRAA